MKKQFKNDEMIEALSVPEVTKRSMKRKKLRVWMLSALGGVTRLKAYKHKNMCDPIGYGA